MTFVHKLDNGKPVDISLDVGELPAKLKGKFRKELEKISSMFYTDQIPFPHVVDSSGNPIYGRLHIRDNAQLKFFKPIKLSPEHNKALIEMIKLKISNEETN